MEILKINTILTSLEDAITFAKGWYAETTGEIIPTMISYTKKNELSLVGLPYLGDRENGGRDSAIRMAMLINALYEVKMYVIVHESWVLESKNDDGSEWIGRIHEHPEAKEKLTLIACSKDQKIGAIYDIAPDRQLVNEMKVDKIDGTFTTFLDLKVPALLIPQMREYFTAAFQTHPQ